LHKRRAERERAKMVPSLLAATTTWGVFSKTHEVRMRETAVLPVFFWGRRGGERPGEVGVMGRARRGCSAEAGKGDDVRQENERRSR
jgi:hypothetical protein